MQSLSSCDS